MEHKDLKKNNLLSKIDTNSILSEIKRIKDNVIKSIKEKKINKIVGKKNNFNEINKNYLNHIKIDISDQSFYDDDLFFLKEDNYEKPNRNLNEFENRRINKRNKRKSKKVVQKKQKLINKKKNPFILSIDEFLETEYCLFLFFSNFYVYI